MMKPDKQMKRGDHLLAKLLTLNGLIDDQSQCCLATFLACNQLTVQRQMI